MTVPSCHSVFLFRTCFCINRTKYPHPTIHPSHLSHFHQSSPTSLWTSPNCLMSSIILPFPFKASCPLVDFTPGSFWPPMYSPTPRLGLFAVVYLSAFLHAQAQTYTATYNPSSLPDKTENGQTGTNNCGTGSSQNSTCQNAYSAFMSPRIPSQSSHSLHESQ